MNSQESEAPEPISKAAVKDTATPPERNTSKPGLTSTDESATASAFAIPADLSFQQARTALDLMIAELQSSDLEVEQMLNLYRRAQAYADHCETVLQQVDQDVIEWDVLQESRESRDEQSNGR